MIAIPYKKNILISKKTSSMIFLKINSLRHLVFFFFFYFALKQIFLAQGKFWNHFFLPVKWPFYIVKGEKEWWGIGTVCPRRWWSHSGGVPEMCRCGIKWHGLVVMVVMGWWLDEAILVVILWFHFRRIFKNLLNLLHFHLTEIGSVCPWNT